MLALWLRNADGLEVTTKRTECSDSHEYEAMNRVPPTPHEGSACLLNARSHLKKWRENLAFRRVAPSGRDSY